MRLPCLHSPASLFCCYWCAARRTMPCAACLTGRFQFAIPLGVDHLLQSRQLVGRRDVAQGTVQADVIVVRRQTPPRTRWASSSVARRRQAKALAFEAAVPTFQLAVALRIVGTGAHVRDARRRTNSLKSLAMNCGPLSLMIRGRSPGNFSRPAARSSPRRARSCSRGSPSGRWSGCSRRAACTGSKTCRPG